MKGSWREDLVAVSYSAALHIALLFVLFIGFNSAPKQFVAPAQVDIVQATVINEQQILEDIADEKGRIEQQEAQEKARLEAIKQQDIDKKIAEEKIELEREQAIKQLEQEKQRELDVARDKAIEQKKKQEDQAQRKVDAEKKRIAEKKQLQLDKQRKEEQAEKERKAAQEKERKAAQEKERKAAQEKERKAAQEKERKAAQEKERKAAQEKERKAAQEKERKATQEKKRKATQEKKRQEAEKKRLADEEKRKKAEADNLLQESLVAEETEREAGRITGIVNQHISMIRQRIKREWIEPANAEKGLQTTLNVSLLPGGDVKQVKVVKTSGNVVFDRSATSAVYKAAPWPQPRDPKAASEVRNFTFVFKPK